MKLIVAIIKPFKIAEVKQALTEAGVARMTVTEVKGFGRQMGHTEIYRGTEYRVDLVPKIRLDIAVDDADVDRTVKIICDAARTDAIGDGKIFVLPIDEAIRIRTGEQGSDAL